MFKVQSTIRDLYGIEYHQPVVVINHINYQSTVRKQSQASPNDPVKDARIFSQNSEFQLSFNALLYVSESAIEKGFKPLALRDVLGSEWFSVPLDSDPSTASEAELIALCERFVQTFIIPKLEVADV